MKSFASKKAQKGQVLLLVVLASVIALTVGLAAVSRSITSTRISSEESNSQKALSAAEAGIEEQINRALTESSVGLLERSLNNNSSFLSDAVAVDVLPNESFEINNGDTIPQDEGADIWLSNHLDFSSPTSVAANGLTVYWHSDGACSGTDPDPAIEIAVIYGASTDNPSMSRYAVDSCSRGNNFSSPTNSGAPSSSFLSGYDTNYNNSYTIPDAIIEGRIARVIPLYNGAKIAVESTADLPVQGYIIESTGRSGDTARKLQVYQGFPKLPIEFFPYNLFLP